MTPRQCAHCGKNRASKTIIVDGLWVWVCGACAAAHKKQKKGKA